MEAHVGGYGGEHRSIRRSDIRWIHIGQVSENERERERGHESARPIPLRRRLRGGTLIDRFRIKWARDIEPRGQRIPSMTMTVAF